jgi:dTDP-4-amino-4,6-dideoxygalactose transaminase
LFVTLVRGSSRDPDPPARMTPHTPFDLIGAIVASAEKVLHIVDAMAKEESRPRTDVDEVLAAIDGYFARRPPATFHPGVDQLPIGAPDYGPEEVKGVVEALLSGWISMGPRTKAFESAFAAYVGTRTAVAVNSGSSANLVAFQALIEVGRLRRGQEVIVPATTFTTVLSPIIQVGLRPVIVDVDPATFNIAPDQVAAAIGPNTGAVVMVHTLGAAADIHSLRSVAARHGLVLIEDCCEAHGTRYQGRIVGGFGDIATSSFYVAHNMTTGEGGMIMTNDLALERAARSLREFGRLSVEGSERYAYDDGVLVDYDERFVFERLGYNVRMTDLTASLGIEQLRKLEAMNEQRIRTADRLTKHLERYAGDLQLPTVPAGSVHTFYAYVVVLRSGGPTRRAELARFLEARRIETRALFAGSLADQPAYREIGLRVVGDLPVARHLRDSALMIGCHPGIRPEHIEYMCGAFDAYFGI